MEKNYPIIMDLKTQYSLCCQSSSVHSFSHELTPWTAACQAFLSITNSRSLLELMSIESVTPSNHFAHGHPLLLVPSIFSSIRVFSSESVLHIRWSKYWSFSFNISFSNEYSGLFSFRIDWLDLLAVQGILKSLLQYHSSKAPISPCSAFFMIQLSHPYMTTEKNTALARWTFVSKVYAISYSQIHLLIYCNSNTISSKLFCGYVENDSQVYIDFKKTQNSQDNTEEQNQKPYITQLLDLLYSFNDQDSLLVKEYTI